MRNAQLDGLRGYAAISVAIFHTILGIDYSQIDRVLHGQWSTLPTSYDRVSKITLMLFNGETPVILFFLISGAVLFHSLMRETTPLAATAKRFVVRRLFRIYPALFVCVCICAVLFNLAGRPITFEQFVLNAGLVDFAVNGATWTLRIELIVPLFLLLCFCGYLIGREFGLAIAALGVMWLFDTPWFRDHLDTVRLYWWCFALGALIPTRVGAFIAAHSLRGTWVIALILTFVMRSTVQHVAAAVLVALLYHERSGSLGAFLTRPVSQFFGRISYSFYLFNVLFLEIICQYLRTQPWAVAHPVEVGLIASLLVITPTIPVAMLSYAVVEMSMNRLGHRLTESWWPKQHRLDGQPMSEPNGPSNIGQRGPA